MDELTRRICEQLTEINKEAGAFVAGILSNDISRDDQIKFAHQLVDLAEVIRDRALHTPSMILDGSVIDDSDPASPNSPDSRADYPGTAGNG